MDFHGGIKLPLNHELTIDKPVTAIKLPERAIVHLSQHSGSTAVPCVSAGDKVKTYDIIARGIGAVSCDIHSPVSGVVESIQEFIHPHYKYSQAIVIKSDGQDTGNGNISVSSKTDYTLTELIEISKKAGIIDTISEGLPLGHKLSEIVEKKAEKNIHYLIISFVQNEPYIHNIETIARNFTQDIFDTISIFNNALKPKFIFLSVAHSRKKLINTLEDYISQNEVFKNVKIIRVTDKYPQQNEVVLANCILKTNIPAKKIIDNNCFIMDAATLFFLHEALKFNKPQIECYMTVSGYGITRPANVKVRIGTPIRDIIEQCGGFCGNVTTVVLNGLMSGFSQYSLDVPVIKSSSALTAMPTERLSSPDEAPCMRCKKCIDHCPVYLNPALLNNLSRSEHHIDTVEAGIYSCIECGVCSYICPSRINITHSIMLSKKKILELRLRESSGING